MTEALIEWYDAHETTGKTRYQPLYCGKCRTLIVAGKIAVIRVKNNQEFAQILCEHCGETLEQRNSKR